MKASALLILIVFSFPVSAGWIDKQGNEIADSDNMKSANSFIAQQIITDNEKQVFKSWGTPSQSVYFPVSDKIERNKIITALIVFGGCAADANGNCGLKMQITVYQRDGDVYSKLPIMEVWSGKPAPPEKSLGLSVGYLRVIIEDGEQLGKYKIATKVTDEIGGDSMLLTSSFTVIEAK